uniref:SART-1 family protein n=1 Tax=Fagus sylvatica TaxID=28930 RepID=A0A2N9EH52_FAGSY
MDMEWSDSKYEHREERDDDSPMREHWDGGDLEHGTDKSSKHRSKDRKKSSRGEDKEHRSKDRERSKRSSDDVSKEREKEVRDSEKDRVSSRDRRKEDRDEREKDRSKDGKVREKEYDREKYREKERDRGGRDKDRAREKNRDKDREKERDRAKEKERDKHKDRENYKDGEREKERSRRTPEEDYDDNAKLDYEDNRDKDASRQRRSSHHAEIEENAEGSLGGAHMLASELEERIMKKREERLNKNSQGASEVLSWVSRSRKLEEKRNAEKEKAMQLSKIFEEQDNVGQGDSEDEEASQDNLAGVKVLHGIDKVVEGGAVVLTLKDQNILADGDVNEEIDMLENVELGEQKQRDEAYKAAKKKTGFFDKFNDDPGAEKKMLPQYDDPIADEGLALDERGRFSGEAEKKLQELRKRLEGASTNNRFEDLNAMGKSTSDYYTQEEMLQFKKPKKKKSLRKKEKLDLDALEAEALSSGLGVGDLGSRNNAKRKAIKEEQERAEAEQRNNAYLSAYAKADEASKSLRMEQTLPVKLEEDEKPVFADDDDDLYKSLDRARKLALKKQEEKPASGPQAIALLATTIANSQIAEDQNPTTGESQENKVVFTEMEEFVWGLQLDEEARKPENEDVFMQEDEEPKASDEEIKDEAGGWTEVKDVSADEDLPNEDKEEIVPDETIHEVAVGKGLSGALKLLQERGTLKESIDWGGRNMDKKKSKLVGIVDADEPKETRSTSLVDHKKEIRIDRLDEFGRIMTPKEAFRMISHKFHGKGPGKMKQEKRMKQYQEELKLKQMKNSDTPSLSVERMREAQMQSKTPYLVLSGHVKAGQTSDPRSGFATVEKDLPGGLTPMLGDRKVEHFLGIKRKAEPANSAPKKPKP